MLEGIKKIKYQKKLEHLFKDGIKKGKIVPFDTDIYKQMSNTYIGGVPMSFYIKYFNPKTPPGNCYERSLGMFICFDNSLLVRANTKNLAIKYGPSDAGHGWIEVDDYVLDSSLLMKIDKNLYYEMYEPYDVIKTDKEEYLSYPDQKEIYDSITKTTIEDYKPYGRKRFELLTNIPILIGIAKKTHNSDYIGDLYEYLKTIDYSEESIKDEINEKIRKIGQKK